MLLPVVALLVLAHCSPLHVHASVDPVEPAQALLSALRAQDAVSVHAALSLGSARARSATASADRLGLSVSSPVGAGETLLELPLSAGLSVESLVSTDSALVALVRSLLEQGVTDTRAFLALHLLESVEQQTAAGELSAHFNALPAFPRTVCFFTDEELKALQAPPESPLFLARTEVQDNMRKLLRLVTAAVDAQPDLKALLPRFDETSWLWAYATVLNRAITLSTRVPVEANCKAATGKCELAERELKTLALLPLLDALNHANPEYSNVKLVVSSTPMSSQEFEEGMPLSTRIALVAKHGLAAGDELLLSYAGEAMPLSNSDLLLQYGFALERNEFEGVALDVGMRELEQLGDPLLEHRKYIISKNNLTTAAVIRMDARIPPGFLQALRVNQLTSADIEHLAGFEYDFRPEHGYFSLQNELKVYIRLISSVEGILSEYPTTLADDLKQLESPAFDALTANVAHALSYRVTIKRVLHAFVLRCFQHLQRVFDQLVQRWEADLDKVLPQLASSDDKAEAQQWKADLAKWRSSVQDWQGTWDGWVRDSIGDAWQARSV